MANKLFVLIKENSGTFFMPNIIYIIILYGTMVTNGGMNAVAPSNKYNVTVNSLQSKDTGKKHYMHMKHNYSQKASAGHSERKYHGKPHSRSCCATVVDSILEISRQLRA